jgi:cyclase
MRRIRVIARLDIKGPNLVKGIHLEGLRVVGDPADFARYYYESGVDELMFVDVVASLYERNSLHGIISEAAKNVFIPITVGGGLRNLDDIRGILKAGADKVSINTAAVKSPQFIRNAANAFGASTIVATIEAIKQPDGQYLAFIDNGREITGKRVVDWAQELESLGAGEIAITSVDREGTGQGFDLDLVESVTSKVSIPVIAHGGPGSAADVVNVVKASTVSAVAVASVFHYDYLRKKNETDDFSRPKSASAEGNIEFLLKRGSFSKIQPASVADVKKMLLAGGIGCRTLKD